MAKHYLIPYVPLKGHKDPDLKELVYGDSDQRGRSLYNNISKGSYLFLHTKIGSCKYITCCIVVESVLSGEEARADNTINADAQFDDWCFVGDKDKSLRLWKPVPFNRKLAEKLSLDIDFSDLDSGYRTELQIIGSATRSQRILTKEDVDMLMSEINRYHENAKIDNPKEVQYHLYFHDTHQEIIPLDEIHKVKETEIQRLLRKNPSVIDEGIKILEFEKPLPDGDRLDLLLEASDKSIIVAEIKGKDKLTDEVPTQLASYGRDIENEYPNRKVRLMIICDGKLSPKLRKACRSLSIEVVVYGVKMDCFKLSL